MRIGDFVRHRKAPEWGIGEVVAGPLDGKVQIRFEVAGTKWLPVALAEDLLEVLDPATLPSDFAIPTVRPAARSRTPRDSRPCAVCSRPLRRSYYSRDRRYKSCPNCSGKDGVHHLYYPYPDAFGLSEARSTDETPDGAQSYCSACRRDEVPGDQALRCGDPRCA